MATTPIGTYSGLVSGLDFYALADQMIAIERQPAVRLEAEISLANKRQASIEQYRSLLTALQDAASDFADSSGLQAYVTTMSNGKTAAGQDVLGAAGRVGAVPGSYGVEVQRLATAQKNVGLGQASSSDALGISGTLEIAGQSVTVGATDSLTDVQQKINALNGGATPTGIAASILRVSETDHRLVLTATETGAENAFTVTDTSGTVAATLGLNQVSTAAQDALMEIDGVAITRASNVVSDAIAGVTLTLKGADVGRVVSLKVERYTSAAKDAAQAFVDAYNGVVGFIKKHNTAPGEGVAPPDLYGDPMLRSHRGRLATTLLQSAAGGAADLATLGSVGINLTKDGLLELDATKFNETFESRYADLEALLNDRGAALQGFLKSELQPAIGALDTKKRAITDSVTRMEDRVAEIDARLDRRYMSLITRFGKFEAEMGRMQALQASMQAQFAQLVPKKE